MKAVSTIEDKSNDTNRLKSDELLNMPPSEKEILDVTNEMKDSAPGRDKVRVRYIKENLPSLYSSNELTSGTRH